MSLRLVCTALYNDGDGERKYLPQFFKFIVANPLSVRTKVLISFFLMISSEFENNHVLKLNSYTVTGLLNAQ